MNRLFPFLALIAWVACMASCAHRQTDPAHCPVEGQPFDTMSWVIGQSHAEAILASGLTVDADMVALAVRSTLEGASQPLSPEDYSKALNQVNLKIYMRQRDERMRQRADADQVEQAYFAQLTAGNKKLRKAPQGFYYEVLREGSGAQAAKGEVAVFDFRSLFTNGQIQEQTYGARPAIVHIIGSPMFEGLQQALCLMRPGSQYRFYFPYRLAFGEEGADGVPPYSTMIYEVELHEVQKG